MRVQGKGRAARARQPTRHASQPGQPGSAPAGPMQGRLRNLVPVAGLLESTMEGVRMAQKVEADHHDSGRPGDAAPGREV